VERDEVRKESRGQIVARWGLEVTEASFCPESLCRVFSRSRRHVPCVAIWEARRVKTVTPIGAVPQGRIVAGTSVLTSG
jgi:hypothetical protein